MCIYGIQNMQFAIRTHKKLNFPYCQTVLMCFEPFSDPLLSKSIFLWFITTTLHRLMPPKSWNQETAQSWIEMLLSISRHNN